MADCRVTCITKPNVNSSHEHITHIGNTGANWKITREQAIYNIDNNIDTFYVMDSNGKRADVGVVRPEGRLPYLRTHADGYWNDNLLALSQCP